MFAWLLMGFASVWAYDATGVDAWGYAGIICAYGLLTGLMNDRGR